MKDTEETLHEVESKLDDVLDRVAEIKRMLGIDNPDKPREPKAPGPYSDMSH